MAIISCPSCDKPISSRTQLCPHCGFERGEVAEEQLKEFHRRRLRDRIYRLKMGSYAALTLLLLAFGWYLVDNPGLQGRPSAGPYLLCALGGAAYAVIRVFLFRSKSALRKLGY